MVIGGMFIVVNIAFVISGVLLYKLSEVYVEKEHICNMSIIVLCVHPSTTFMIVPYTESIFNMFTFAGIFMLSQSKPLQAAAMFSLASAFRSNGILNGGFLVYLLILPQIQQRRFSARRTLECIEG
eukprot:TRINITY_DN33417_c0_g1_i1.p2 TRINITY_DN33417_c0_g1~~TRINITY_DN33417_c0_g1_i1.p2  ORF type:complete len:126 (-),score=5.27 TRINITY_DN33417_c0_g1_i1:11-388(-)